MSMQEPLFSLTRLYATPVFKVAPPPPPPPPPPPADALTEKLSTARPVPPFHISKPYSTSSRYHEDSNCPRDMESLKNGRRFRLADVTPLDRKSTRLNSSHLGISYAVFCLQ